MLVASVIVDIPTRSLSTPFDYLVPHELTGVDVGCAVSVEFGSRPVVGYVIALQELSEQDYERSGGNLAKLKSLAGVLSTPYFDEVCAGLAHWVSREYLCPLPDALHLFTPPGGAPKIKRIDGSWQLVHPGAKPVDDRWVFPTELAEEFVPGKNAPKQKKVLEALSCGGMRVAELKLEFGSVDATLKSLAKKGVVRIETRRRIREAMPSTARPDVNLDKLTDGQAEALAAIAEESALACACSEGGDSSEHVVVVDGITGSGKTEIYLRAIAQTLDQGKGAIVLVPEIALTPQTVGRFRARFGDDVAVLHSRLSTGERFDQWDMIREGAVHVVVGTRSALFAPLRKLGLVIIDEEHDSSYKQDSAPRYCARDVALELCRRRGCTLVLGSATPAITTLHACESVPRGRGWRRVELSERPSGQKLPQVSIVDMANEFNGGSRSMFSAELLKCLDEVYKRHEKAVLLLNRRGFASFMLCRECGFVPECPQCSVSLTYHERDAVLACHHCGYTQAVPPRCPECGSIYLAMFGKAGTERVEAKLREVVPADMPIVRMDADTTRTKGAHEALLEQFAQNDGGILLGTQMIAKGLDFPDVTLVGVIDADSALKLPDFRAPERTYQLLEQVSGRAGRDELPGRVVVQTYWPEHPAIRAAAAHDRSIFLEDELAIREELAYPPYSRLANLLVWGKRETEVRKVITEVTLALVSAVESAGAEWVMLGPSPCVLARLRGVYRWHTLVKAPPDTSFFEIIDPVLRNRKPHEDVRVAVDVDPYSLF